MCPIRTMCATCNVYEKCENSEKAVSTARGTRFVTDVGMQRGMHARAAARAPPRREAQVETPTHPHTHPSASRPPARSPCNERKPATELPVHEAMQRSSSSLISGQRMPTFAGTRTSFGKQKLSTSKSNPAFGFGVATREVAGKVFVSQEHTALATAGTHSPGPAVYVLPPSVGGKQPDGRKPDPPVWAFGRDERFRPGSAPNEPAPNRYSVQATIGEPQVLSRVPSEPKFGFGTATRHQMSQASVSRERVKDLHGTESPGPQAEYKVSVGAIGKQINSKYATTPKFSIATRANFARKVDGDVGEASPGPMYCVPAAVGSQPESNRKGAGRAVIGSATRENQAKVFISREHGKGIHGRDTPGPQADYYISGSLGKQISSKSSTRPSSAFSKASRWGQYERESRQNSVPGPGSYND